MLKRRWLRVDIAALRLFLRAVPAENQRVVVLTLLLGALCGLVAVAFHLAIQGAERLLIERALDAPGGSWIIWTILTPTLGGLLSGAALTFLVPDARGSGIPQVKVAYAVRGGRIPLRVTLGKFALGVLQIGTGASLGREGPTVQICAGIASALGEAAALSRLRLRQLLPVGAAAGIAAAFNAPLAAVTFTIEEVVGDLDHTILSGVVVAAALAAVVERSVLGTHPVFTLPAGYGLHHASSLLLYALLGVVAALVAVLFSQSLLRLRAGFQRLRAVPAWARPAIGGLLTGLLAVVALLSLHVGGITGAGYATLSDALAGKLALQVLVALCVLKIAATVCSYSSGGAGGLFAPTLFVGGMLGGAVGWLDVRLLGHDPSEVGAFALVGMGAVFAGVIRAPITSVLIIFEMTGGYDLILPLMLANMTAFALARRWRPLPIYDALLAQDGITLPHGNGVATPALQQLAVAQAMTPNPMTLPATATVAASLDQLASLAHSTVPIVAADGAFVGLISEARLRRTLAEGGGETHLAELADRRTPVRADQPLLAAAQLMEAQATRQLAVVDPRALERLAGIVTMSDIVRALAQAARTAHGDTPGAVPPFSEAMDTLRGAQESAAPGSPTEAAVPALQAQRVVLDANAPATGLAVRDLALPSGALLVTVERGAQTIVPHGSTVLEAGDQVTVFAPPPQLEAALATLRGAPQEHDAHA